MIPGQWYRVTVPHFCCAVVVQGARIVDAAPIMRWAVGKEASEVGRWVRGKGGTVEKLRSDE